jgi:ACS family pantothenate transporter-like MFS transporter
MRRIFSGYLQAGLFKGMDEKLALDAWRWFFIFDFILAIPVALYGYSFYPDTPQTTTAFLRDWTKSALNKGSRKMVELMRAN